MKARLGFVGAVWGILGVLGILGFAIARLTPVGVAAVEGPHPFGPLHWLALAASLVFFAYTEGYRAFQLQFSPRVVARALSLIDAPTPVRVVLAPLFCMGFFGATRKRMIVTWSLSLGIVVLIRLVGALAQPWRGIIDLGVVVALAWGALAILAIAVRALSGDLPGIATDLPEGEAHASA